MMYMKIYLEFDIKEKEKLRAEETEKRLTLKVLEEDPHGIQLAKKIIQKIAHEYILEK